MPLEDFTQSFTEKSGVASEAKK